MKDFYYILGTEVNCTLDEIKEAYRKLSKKFHPDLNDGDTYFENRFKEIQEAYETLSNPVKRLQYNQALKNFRAPLDQSEGHKQESSSDQAAQTYYQQRTKRHKSVKRGPGVAATIALLLLGLIISMYAFQYFGNTKKIKVKQVADATDEMPVVIHKHHKKKHLIKVSADSVKSETETIISPGGKPVISPIVIDKPILLNPNSSINVPTYKGPDKNPSADYPYATNVHTNATGIVNLRESGRFGSTILQTIPANAKVLVLEKGNVYAKVSYNNSIGYVPKWSVENR